ncbi:MAG: glycosyltransferase [Gemmatimonadaceae bacterium]
MQLTTSGVESQVELLLAGTMDVHPASAFVSGFLQTRYRQIQQEGVASVLNLLVDDAIGDLVLLIPRGVRPSSQIILSAFRIADQLNDEVGAIAGLLIDIDGYVSEAGLDVDEHGHIERRNVGSDAALPRNQFSTDVDGCERAMVLTKRDTFRAFGGFDPGAAAYVFDFCSRLRKRGQIIRFDSGLCAIDIDSALYFTPLRSWRRRSAVSAVGKTIRGARKLRINDDTSLATEEEQLQRKLRILVLDDRVPHSSLGQGYPRSNLLLKVMVELGYQVTFYPLLEPNEEWRSVYQDISRQIEVQTGSGVSGLSDFLRARLHTFDAIFVSRPHNMSVLNDAFDSLRIEPKIPLIYDAEALFSLREIELEKLRGTPPDAAEIERRINAEVRLARRATSVVAVSDIEGEHYRSRGVKAVHTLGHAVSVGVTNTPFSERKSILFVGPLLSNGTANATPNVDGMDWFCSTIFPILRNLLGNEAQLVIAGAVDSEIRERFSAPDIQLLGRVGELAYVYEQARVFIAPVRFSAGIPLKILEAAAHGVPTVATPLLAHQLSWREGTELLCASDAQRFANECARLYRDESLWSDIRQAALRRVEVDASHKTFVGKLRTVILAADKPNPNSLMRRDRNLADGMRHD